MLVLYRSTLRQGVWRQHVPRLGREQFAVVRMHRPWQGGGCLHSVG